MLRQIFFKCLYLTVYQLWFKLVNIPKLRYSPHDFHKSREYSFHRQNWRLFFYFCWNNCGRMLNFERLNELSKLFWPVLFGRCLLRVVCLLIFISFFCCFFFFIWFFIFICVFRRCLFFGRFFNFTVRFVIFLYLFRLSLIEFFPNSSNYVSQFFISFVE